MARILLQISYDGTAFHGWQRQSGRRSVQGDLEQALKEIAGVTIKVTGSGRTDAGVHAWNQYAHLEYPGSLTLSQLRLVLNARLADDLRVLAIHLVPDGFHARYQAAARSYRYLLARQPHPLNRLYMGFLPRLRLDFQAMAQLAEVLRGSHDFSSLSRENPDVPNHICQITTLEICDRGDHLRFDITADRFLHHMVRRIVGTLANLAQRGLGPNVLQGILEERNPRQRLVLTAPACGLHLLGVSYPDLRLDVSAPRQDW